MQSEWQPPVAAGPGGRDHLGLVELVHRVLDRGALITGDVVISVAGIDLVYVGLRVLLSSVETMEERGLAVPRGASASPALPDRPQTEAERDDA